MPERANTVKATDPPRAAEVSIIVPFYNPGPHFETLLLSLVQQDGLFEVILVDNGSTDCSRTVAERFIRQMPGKIVDARAFQNQSYATNVGVRASSTDKILFADADDELAPGYVSAMADALKDCDFVCSAADSLTLNEEWVQQSYGRPWSGFVPNSFGFLDATGVNIGIRRELFDKLGGFPEDMSASTDVAFSWMAQLAGSSVVQVHSAVYRYRLRHSISSLFRQACNYGRSNALLYRKFRHNGMPGRSMRVATRAWRYTFGRFVRARSRSDLAHVAVCLGYCTGRLLGSVRYRVIYL